MDAKALLARMAAQRESWADLPDGKRIKFRRPYLTEVGSIQTDEPVDQVIRFAIGWEGFTEADLLGAAIGASDPIDFDSAVWAEVVRDRLDYILPVFNAIVKSLNEFTRNQAAVEKNS